MTNHSLEACMSELDLSGRSFLTVHDFTPAEVVALLYLATELKAAQKRREPHPVLAGRAVALIFMKTSTRTRISFEVGVEQLGAQPMFLSANDMQLRVGETLKDTANVMSRYVDCIMIRTFAQKDVEDLAEYGQIPVINGLTDTHHPCQGMADALTIREHCGRLDDPAGPAPSGRPSPRSREAEWSTSVAVRPVRSSCGTTSCGTNARG